MKFQSEDPTCINWVYEAQAIFNTKLPSKIDYPKNITIPIYFIPQKEYEILWPLIEYRDRDCYLSAEEFYKWREILFPRYELNSNNEFLENPYLWLDCGPERGMIIRDIITYVSDVNFYNLKRRIKTQRLGVTFLEQPGIYVNKKIINDADFNPKKGDLIRFVIAFAMEDASLYHLTYNRTFYDKHYPPILSLLLGTLVALKFITVYPISDIDKSRILIICQNLVGFWKLPLLIRFRSEKNSKELLKNIIKVQLKNIKAAGKTYKKNDFERLRNDFRPYF
ncbi:MAG: hypothetical protein ACTSVV_17625 [Promethearchaeota archaeon]